MKLELYKCVVLTVIAALLAVLAWRTPPRPLTLERVRAEKLKGWKSKLPLVYVGAGDIDVGTVDGTVEVSGAVEIEK